MLSIFLRHCRTVSALIDPSAPKLSGASASCSEADFEHDGSLDESDSHLASRRTLSLRPSIMRATSRISEAIAVMAPIFGALIRITLCTVFKRQELVFLFFLFHGRRLALWNFVIDRSDWRNWFGFGMGMLNTL
jgi:hypothetical protein